MDIVRATILERGIDDTLWPKIMLAMTYIKNLWPTWELKGNISPIEIQNKVLPDFQQLCILGSNIYVFLHEEEKSLKLAKWKARALKWKLVGFDCHTIYRVYIKDQNKVILVKDLRIFKNITSKLATLLPDFEKKPTFNGVQVSHEQELFNKSNASEKEKYVPKKSSKKPTKVWAGRDKEIKAFKKENAPEVLPQRQLKSRGGRTIKPTTKKQKGMTPLIAQLTSLLNKNWEDSKKITAFVASCKDNQDPGNKTLKSGLN